MKIKVEVDLNDLYCEDSETIGEAVAQDIRCSIVREVKYYLQDAIQKQIRSKVNEKVDELITKKSTVYISNYLKRGKIKKDTYSEEEITIEEFIKDKFIKDTGWTAPKAVLEKLANGVADELKKRYDLLFASQIVSKLADKNLLVDRDIAKLLLGDADE